MQLHTESHCLCLNKVPKVKTQVASISNKGKVKETSLKNIPFRTTLQHTKSPPKATSTVSKPVQEIVPSRADKEDSDSHNSMGNQCSSIRLGSSKNISLREQCMKSNKVVTIPSGPNRSSNLDLTRPYAAIMKSTLNCPFRTIMNNVKDSLSIMNQVPL